jgi:protein-S-isoprenylcysteine O-methyltransferase Ste14
MMAVIRIGGLALWLSPLIYLINPAWMAWSRIGLPEWARWLGVGIGVCCTFMIYWLFSSIGSGITPTSATRTEHTLVTRGPYRWVRHPLYTVGSSVFISFGMMADSWFIAALGVLAFIAMAIRTPKEESNLIEKFGEEYREYMKRTGAFLPRLKGNSNSEQNKEKA